MEVAEMCWASGVRGVCLVSGMTEVSSSICEAAVSFCTERVAVAGVFDDLEAPENVSTTEVKESHRAHTLSSSVRIA
jgi:hypothetical protein